MSTPRYPATKLAAMAASVFLASPAIAQTQDWPNRALTFVVPSSPGGGTDVFARLLAEGVSAELKQNIIVENKPGASGNIGAAHAARAAGDGYTILVSATPAIAVNPYLYKNLPYDAETAFVPVARGVDAPLMYVVPAGSKYTSLKQLIDDAKKAPDTLSFGSAGHGSPTYLGVRAVEEVTGAAFTHVPYKGMAPAMQDFLGGRLTFLQSDIASVLPHLKAGKAVPIAVSQKSPLYPDVEVWTEQGLPDVPQSFSVVAPAGTPEAIVNRLSDAINKAMENPATRQKLLDQGYLPVKDTPAKFAEQLKQERAHWKALIERNNIVVE